MEGGGDGLFTTPSNVLFFNDGNKNGDVNGAGWLFGSFSWVLVTSRVVPIMII